MDLEFGRTNASFAGGEANYLSNMGFWRYRRLEIFFGSRVI